MTATPKSLGPLPEWNLADLYASPEDPQFAADMKRGEELARAFADTYRGKLAALPGEALAQALKDYEVISDLLGRTGSYAQLHYVGDTTDSQRGKFYGDASAKLRSRARLRSRRNARFLRSTREVSSTGCAVERSYFLALASCRATPWREE